MTLIDFATIASRIADVTPTQIGKAHKCFDSDNKAFYMVESEDGKVDEDGYIVEYRVTYSKQNGFQCTCKSGQNGFANCTKYGVCKHVRWSVACAIEESEAFKRQDTMVLPAVKVEYTDVDAQTLARIARRDAERKERKPDTRKVAYCQTRPGGFSLMR